MGCAYIVKKEIDLIKSKEVHLDFDTTLNENQATIYNNVSLKERKKCSKGNEVINNNINETIASGPIITLLKREVNNHYKKKINQ